VTLALESELVGPGGGSTPVRFAELEVEQQRLSPPVSRFDLGLCMRIEAGALVGDLEYSVDLYDEATVVRLAESFARVVAEAVVDPQRRLSRLSAIDEGERERLLGGRETVRPGRAAAKPTPAPTLPRTEVERALADAWKSVLGVADVVIDDDFFELGGDSLLAARAVAATRERLGVDFPLRLFLDTPTIRAQAEVVEQVREVLARFGR
jgi:acyl carrier protein